MAKWLIFMIALTGCASDGLLRAKDYQLARKQLADDQPALALAEFPNRGERNGFLTTIEKGYLGLLSGQADPKPLVKISDQLENREVIKVSQELGTFFYNESEDGYLPAEHEVIFLHLLAGYSFASRGDFEGARIEAQRSAELLQGHYSERTGDFDDPGLRLLLAGLWLYCDEWEHARVDLRRAYEMDSRLRWAKDAAEKSEPPSHLHIVLAGIGPEPKWNPNSTKAALTGLNSLEFKISPLSLEPLSLTGENGPSILIKSPLSTENWYKRHQLRNHEIRDLVEGSRYFTKVAGKGAVTGSGLVATKLVSGAIVIIGITAAVVIVGGAIYLLAEAGAGSAGDVPTLLTSMGLGIGGYALSSASKFNRDSTKALTEDWNETMDPAPTYRYLRFLPDAIFGSLTPRENAWLIDDWSRRVSPFVHLESKKHRSKVYLYFTPRLH